MEVNDVSVILASRSPKELAEFYAIAINAKACQGENIDHWSVAYGNGLRIQFYKPSKNQSLLIKGRGCSLCIEGNPSDSPLSDIRKWSLFLASRGATLLEKAKLESFGAEVWMEDPEGNNFLLLIPIA